jgi:hypothetical protein
MDNLRNKALPKEAIAKIESIRQANESYEGFFRDKQNEWNDKYQKLTVPISEKLSIETYKGIDKAQNLSLSYSGEIIKEIALYKNKLNKEEVFLKEDNLDTTIFMVSGMVSFKFKTAEQSRAFMNAVTAERERACAIIKSYIDFLTDLKWNLTNFQNSIKNIIELIKLLNT